jgi:integrase
MPIKKVRSKRFKSGYGYQVSIDRAGLPRIRKTFETYKLAKDVEEAILGDHVRRKFSLPVESRITLRELVEKHLAVTKAKGRDRVNWKRSETVLYRLRDLLGGDRTIESLKRVDLQEYVTARLSQENPPKPQTVNREMNEIKGCLSAATSYYRALEDWRPPKGAWLEEPTDGRRQTWTREQIEAVLSELYGPARKGEKDDHIKGRRATGDMFVVALQTGMRAGEVRRLRKTEVNFSKRIILVTSKKGMSVRRSAKSREIPMTDDVYDILSRRYEEAAGDYLFPGKSADVSLSSYLKTFYHACKRAGVPYGLNGDGSLIFNDARRTAENIMLEAGHGARAVGDILGHSTETMARHYARSTAETRRAAIESARNFGGILAGRNGEGGKSGKQKGRAKAAKGSKQ